MSARQGDMDAWRAGVRARQAREHVADEVAEQAIKAGLDGLLSWGQVEDLDAPPAGDRLPEIQWVTTNVN